MANENVNKVIYGNDTLIDLTGDSVSPQTLLVGQTAHDRSGSQIVGVATQGHTIIDASGSPVNAESGLQFATMQVTDDSTNGKTVVRHIVDVTQAQYDALPSSKNSDNIIYHITDANANPLNASSVTYSNTTSGMSATNVQSAVDEVNSDLADKQPKTLATAQTIGGTSRSTVEAALGALADSNYLEDSLTSSSAVKALTAKQGKALADKHKVSSFTVDTTGWTSDTSSQSGTTLYKKSVSLSHVYVSSPSVDIGTSSGTGLPTAAQQTDYNLLQYVTVDDTVPCLYLYASAIPSATFYIKVEGVD